MDKIIKETYVLEKSSCVYVHKVFGNRYYIALAEIDGQYPDGRGTAYDVNRSEYFVVCSGSVVIIKNGIEKKCKRRDSVFIRPGDFYKISGKAQVLAFVKDDKGGRTENIDNLDTTPIYDEKSTETGAIYDSITAQTPLEEYSTIAEKIVSSKVRKGKIRVLDIACGTALVGQKLVLSPNVVYTGLDNSENFVNYAREKLERRKDFKVIYRDFFSFAKDPPNRGQYDVAVLASAYHHFVRKDRAKLLKVVATLLGENGKIVIYEKAISPYKTRKQYESSCELFYDRRVEFLKQNYPGFTYQQELGLRQLRDISILGRDTLNNEIEEKAAFQEIKQNVKKAGLRILSVTKIDSIFKSQKIGDLVLEVIR